MSVLAELAENLLHSAVVGRRMVRIAFDSHAAQSGARRPDHATLVAAVIDFAKHHLRVEFDSVRRRIHHEHITVSVTVAAVNEADDVEQRLIVIPERSVENNEGVPGGLQRL